MTDCKHTQMRSLKSITFFHVNFTEYAHKRKTSRFQHDLLPFYCQYIVWLHGNKQSSYQLPVTVYAKTVISVLQNYLLSTGFAIFQALPNVNGSTVRYFCFMDLHAWITPKKHKCFAFYLLNRAEKIWRKFVSCTIRAPNILLRGAKYRVRKSLCGNHSVKKPFGKLIFNLILTSWKVIGYSKKEQIEDLNIFCYISLFSLEGIINWPKLIGKFPVKHPGQRSNFYKLQPVS